MNRSAATNKPTQEHTAESAAYWIEREPVIRNGEYRDVLIATLTESPTNPRRRFDEKALEELAATFKTQGVLEPLLVRELEERNYQVVIGARRLRAAKIAELEAVPVLPRCLSTQEVNSLIAAC